MSDSAVQFYLKFQLGPRILVELSHGVRENRQALSWLIHAPCQAVVKAKQKQTNFMALSPQANYTD
jgi:hypothetical protein